MNAQNEAGQATTAVQQKIDEGTSKVGDIAEKAASAVRDRQSMADDAAENVATRLEGASEYLHDANAETLRSDVTEYVKKHPVQALVIGALGGFLVARVLSH